jgi:hypothetical protein
VDKGKRAHASGPFGIGDMNTILAQTGCKASIQHL